MKIAHCLRFLGLVSASGIGPGQFPTHQAFTKLIIFAYRISLDYTLAAWIGTA